jgi:hypothetical protein
MTEGAGVLAIWRRVVAQMTLSETIRPGRV